MSRARECHGCASAARGRGASARPSVRTRLLATRTPWLLLGGLLGGALALAGWALAAEPAAATTPSSTIPGPDNAAPSADPEARAHALMAQDPPDWAGAHAAFEAAAAAGSASAMSYLGWLYEEGHGVPADGARAAAWYARAARAGALDYAVKLGWMFLAGDGVPADRAQAEAWFKYAIAGGHAPAQIALASVLIADAQGGRDPHRVSEANALLQQALDAGQDLATLFLTRLYLEGIGGHPVDDERAAHYARIGAAAGQPQLQGWLAAMYYRGRGVAADPVTAAMWAMLAAAAGDPFGAQVEQALAGELSAEDLASARRRAEQWVPRRP